MSDTPETIFLLAFNDLREGSLQPMESYLERVSSSERKQLTDMLAAYFASRKEPADPHGDPEMFERTLAAVNRTAAERQTLRSGLRVLAFEDRTEIWSPLAGEPIVLKPGEAWGFEFEVIERVGRGQGPSPRGSRQADADLDRDRGELPLTGTVAASGTLKP